MMHADILGERARLSPERTALLYVPSQHRFTYSELNARASRCASLWFDRCGLRKGDRVGIFAKNRVEFLDAFFAAGKSGIILVPLNTRLTPAEISAILKDAGIRALLYDGELSDKIKELKPLCQLEYWIALDEPVDRTDLGYQDVIADRPSDHEFEKCNAEDIYCLLYTSGTTGQPKGVMIPHRMVAWNGYNTAMCWQLREDDISPVFTPLYHAGGLAAFLVPIFAAGGTIVLHRDFDVQEVLATIQKEKCTVALGVPTIWKMILEAPEFDKTDFSHVRWLISGGAPLPVELVEAYHERGLILKQGYGLTEVGVNCFSMTAEEAIRKKGSIGKPMMFTEAWLHGEGQSGQGELCFRGPHVCGGYWNNPKATAAAIDADGWFHTGDVARRDEEGFFYIVGRSKDMFISGGVNVYPAEVEVELLKHPSVSDAAVIGVPHPTWGEVGVAFVVAASSNRPSAEGLTDFLAKKLARYKIPRNFIFVESLPRTAYGKVVKGELRQTFKRLAKEVNVPRAHGQRPR
ncbi:MAG TPA: long-chain fatty acid--CoA ligase [Verrucomicrobiae bacterium]|nr:long-chain fatty acid--CoA ligase [Verrucomicrobiae bacterium]